MGRIYNNIVETVGRTPLVRLNKVTQGVDATILLKCEFFNPLGSVKDRIGMSMIEDAEKRGILKPGIAFVEKSFTPETLLARVREVLDTPATV